jgi:hypothetical protein
MLYLLENPGQAKAIGSRGLDFVQDKVDNRRRSERFAALYRAIIQRKGL